MTNLNDKTIEKIGVIGYNRLLNCGVPERKINKGIQDHIKGKTTDWKMNCLKVGKELSFDPKYLPKDVIELITNENSENEIRNKEILSASYLLKIKHAYEVGFKDHLGTFHYKTDDDVILEKAAKKCAVLLECVNIYIELSCKRSIMLKLYNSLKSLEINYYNSPPSFRFKFRKLLNSDNFAEEIIHKATGKINKGAQKVTEWHRLKIIELLKLGLSRTQILEELNKSYTKNKISYTTLLRYITTEVKNITAEKRYGYDFFKKHLEPYIRRQKPKYKFQVVEADGSRFQIPYLNKSGKVKFLKIFVLLDVCTSKVLGFNLAEEETTEMILEAFSMMFDHYNLVPSCVITDKSSSITSNRFQKFKDETNKFYKTLWREHLPDYPNSKGTVENFFRNFHIQIAKKYFDYLGLSITANSDDHRINKDKLKYIYKNKKSLKNREELILFAATLIHKWNTHITKSNSPQQRFELMDTKDAQFVKKEFIARLCWEKVERKAKRSKVQLNGFEYEIIKNENRTKWNTELLDVFYHPKIEDYVFIFSGDNFIEKAKKKKFYNENSKEKLSKITANKSFRSYLNQRLKRNKKELDVIEANDPLVSMYYEETKDESNSQYESFLSKYILPDNVNPEPDFYEEKSTPTIQFSDDY